MVIRTKSISFNHVIYFSTSQSTMDKLSHIRMMTLKCRVEGHKQCWCYPGSGITCSFYAYSTFVHQHSRIFDRIVAAQNHVEIEEARKYVNWHVDISVNSGLFVFDSYSWQPQLTHGSWLEKIIHLIFLHAFVIL